MNCTNESGGGLTNVTDLDAARELLRKRSRVYRKKVVGKGVISVSPETDVDTLMRHYGFPERLLNVSLDNLNIRSKLDEQSQSRAFQIVRNYIANWDNVLRHGYSLTFVGTPGTGKSSICCAIARAVVQRGGYARYVTMSGYMRRMRSARGYSTAENEHGVFEQHVMPDLLVIDEVGRSPMAEEQVRAHLFDLIDARVMKIRPTLVVSNLDLAEFHAFMGDAMISRLSGDGSQILPCVWEDFRKVAREPAR